MGFDAGFSRKLAERGWVGVTLPSEYGGAGLRCRSRASCWWRKCWPQARPLPRTGSRTARAGRLINKFGTEAQRAFYLPRICAGEAFFCIGMSEPNSGSDLASVGTRATRATAAGA